MKLKRTTNRETGQIPHRTSEEWLQSEEDDDGQQIQVLIICLPTHHSQLINNIE